MKTFGPGSIVPVIAIASQLFSSALGQEPSPATASTPSAKSAAPATVVPAAQTGSTNQALAEVLKLVDAGVNKDIIRLFVEKSPATYALTADDVVTLKQRGVSDEITSALLNKRADTRRPSDAESRPERAPRNPPPAYSSPGGIDPDSYAYFQRYYLHPRAIAAAYQRLGFYGLGQPFWGSPFFRPYFP